MKRQLCIEEVERFTGEMKRLKYEKDQVLEMVGSYWAQGENDNEIK